MATLTLEKEKIEFKSVVDLLNYLVDNLDISIENINLWNDFLNNNQNKRLDNLIDNIK